MISTGNDIVALQLIDVERTRKKSFYSKILSSQEILLYPQVYANSISFEHYVWLLWSVKESVYKFCKRNDPQLLFSPTSINLLQLDLPIAQQAITGGITAYEGLSFSKETCYCSQVNYGTGIWYARSFITNELIFTVVNDEDNFQQIYWGVRAVENEVYETQAEAVRSFTIEKLRKIFPSDDLCIEKNAAGYPEIAEFPQIKISFAHHGKFVAYSLKLN